MIAVMGVKGLQFTNANGFQDFLNAIYCGNYHRSKAPDGFVWSSNGFGQSCVNVVLTEYDPLIGEHFSTGQVHTKPYEGFAGNVGISGEYGFIAFCTQYFGVNNVVYKDITVGKSPFIGVLS